MSGHIPKLLGTWRLSTINFGKSASQERQDKERKFVWLGVVFQLVKLVHENKAENKKTELEVDATMEGEF